MDLTGITTGVGGSSPRGGWGYGSGSGRSPNGLGRGWGFGFGSGSGSGSDNGYGSGSGGGGSSEVDPFKGEGIATRIEGLTLDGDLDPDGMHITNLPLELSDDDMIKQGQSRQKYYTEK
ncbi:hypothetical protein K7X08_026572 [Anisodus acutangulus]|uniref:Uncharacterized protein n=1 Tax=Anisodus acutangulus TaxID=402998 RepID=A0A9Q1LNE0_9SOLA|nr:hypothetical protein K7X08_026572 [Anisodus acutangulus]